MRRMPALRRADQMPATERLTLPVSCRRLLRAPPWERVGAGGQPGTPTRCARCRGGPDARSIRAEGLPGGCQGMEIG